VRYLAGLVSLLACVAGSVVLGPGCFNSSEGQPCSTYGENAGDNECKNGLVCTPYNLLNGGGYTKDVCCPTDRSQSTTVICDLPSNPVPDASPPPAIDAESDAAPPADSAMDAPKDAPQDSHADASDASDAKGEGGD
jgi:hypothetical protein